MQVGITGHQEREGIDWTWVEVALRKEICRISGVQSAFSSLAKGTDQVFAQVAISLGIPVIAVIPVRDYERCFRGKDRDEYYRLLSRSKIKDLNWRGDDQLGFLSAGKFIAENVDLLFAVWDEQKPKGLGGTGDVVEYALQISRKVIHLNPITERVQELRGES